MRNRITLVILMQLLAAFYLVSAASPKEDFETGSSYFKQMQLDSAIYYFKRSLDAAPENYVPRLNLAVAYYYNNDLEKSEEQFTKLSYHNDNDILYYKLYTNVLINLKKYDDARATIQYGIAKFPNSAELYEEYGLIYTQDGRTDSSKVLWEKGVEVNPAYQGNYTRLKLYHKGIGDYVGMAYYLEMSLNLSRDLEQFRSLNKELYEVYQKGLSHNDSGAKLDLLEESLATIILKRDEFHRKFQETFDAVEMNSFPKDKKRLTLDEIAKIKARFYEIWFKQGYETIKPNPITERIKLIRNAGLLEAYGYWLMSEGNENELMAWATTNRDNFEKLIKLMAENPIVPAND